MKKKRISIFLPIIQALAVALVLTSAACTSTPSSAAAGGSKGPVSSIGEARQRAIDFEAPAYFPSDWETIETKYDSGKNSSAEAVAAYNEIFEKTIPLYAQAREDEIMAIREDLLRSGFTTFLPDYLKNADDIALAALEQYEAGDYYKSRDTADEALKEYKTLLLGAKVYTTRQEIINRGFIEYDTENYEKANEIAQTAMEEYDSGNKEAAVISAEEALLRFNIVLTNGWTAYAAERRAAAILEREYAVENKANIAVRESFREADGVFNQAEDNFKNEKFDSAAIQFTEAEARFVLASQETEEKRQRAIETIIQAEEKIEESVETASEAEKIIEGGSR